MPSTRQPDTVEPTSLTIRFTGFSLVETALVLLIIGIFFSLGTASWSSLAASRRMAQTNADLFCIRQCLFRHVIAGGRYPTYQASVDCSEGQKTDLGVCLCQTGVRDVWGNTVLFLEGRDENGDGLAGKSVGESLCLEQSPAAVDSASLAVDDAGNVHESVAFVLISLGTNGAADGSYGVFFSGETARTMDQTIDFSSGCKNSDDQYLIVTTRELRAALRE